MERPDKHHILFSRQRWETYHEGTSLRNTRALIPLMDKETHRELHRNVPLVPLIGYYALCGVRRNFETTNDTFRDIALLQSLIEASNNHSKAHDIEKGIGNLAIQALDLQIPYIKEGIINK